MTNHALGRSLVCQVHSKDKSGISIVLYDTSNSDEDVNINEKLIQIYRPNNGALKTSNGSSNTPSRRESPGKSKIVMQKIASKMISFFILHGLFILGPPPLEDPFETRSDASSPMPATIGQDLKDIDLATLKPLMLTTVPEVDDFFDINVTLAASPSNFTVSF